MNLNPHHARAVFKKRGNLSLTRADTVTYRALDAVLVSLAAQHPGLSVDDALRAGHIRAHELSAAHAWAERVTGL